MSLQVIRKGMFDYYFFLKLLLLMIRTTITPANSRIVLRVPEEYIGKKIEVLIFDVEEVNSGSPSSETTLKPSSLRGFLSHETADALQQHIQQSRNEWDTL